MDFFKNIDTLTSQHLLEILGLLLVTSILTAILVRLWYGRRLRAYKELSVEQGRWTSEKTELQKTMRDLVDDKERQDAELDSFKMSKANLQDSLNNAQKERDALLTDSYNLTEERDKLVSDKDFWETQNNTLTTKVSALMADQSAKDAEYKNMYEYKDLWETERRTLLKDKHDWEKERETILAEKSDWEQEKEGFLKNKGIWEEEKAKFAEEQQYWQKELELVRNAKNQEPWEEERTNLLEERKTWQNEMDALRLTAQTAEREKTTLRQKLDDALAGLAVDLPDGPHTNEFVGDLQTKLQEQQFQIELLEKDKQKLLATQKDLANAQAQVQELKEYAGNVEGHTENIIKTPHPDLTDIAEEVNEVKEDAKEKGGFGKMVKSWFKGDDA